MKEKAADYDVEITEDEQKAIEDAAAAFMKDNDEDTIKELSVTEDQVKTLLELETYQKKMQDPIKKEGNIRMMHSSQPLPMLIFHCPEMI